MIISKTPLRMSFVGGGTDLPSYYRRETGAVVSTAINKHIYVTVNKKFDEKLRVSYSKTENVNNVLELEHPLVREVLKYLDINGGLEITSVADVPSKGTGLGSSSSFTVGLLNALFAYIEKYSSAETLANLACKVEIDILGEPIGKQDQYAAAYGGFNLIEFHPDDAVSVRKLIISKKTVEQFEKQCLIFYTGKTRSASGILKEQNSLMQTHSDKFEALKKMSALAYQMAEYLQNNSLQEVGEILHENWILKKSLSKGISDDWLDDLYDKGRKLGATGGKILGAGAGGFFLFFAPEDRHPAIKKALSELTPVHFGFENQGSSIIFVH